MNRLREEECYHVTGLIRTASMRPNTWSGRSTTSSHSRVLDHDGSKGTQPLDHVEARKTLDEAYDCASLALTYIFEVCQHQHRSLRTDERRPPF